MGLKMPTETSQNPTRYCNSKKCPAGLEQFGPSPIASCPVDRVCVKVDSLCRISDYVVNQYLAQSSPSDKKLGPKILGLPVTHPRIVKALADSFQMTQRRDWDYP